MCPAAVLLLGLLMFIQLVQSESHQIRIMHNNLLTFQHSIFQSNLQRHDESLHTVQISQMEVGRVTHSKAFKRGAFVKVSSLAIVS